MKKLILINLPKRCFGDPLLSTSGKGWECDKNILAFQSHFQARSDDIILASSLKTGTTWLKARCIHALLEKNPHSLVLTLENEVYGSNNNSKPDEIISGLPSPKLFHTHLPYGFLPISIKTNSDCKIVYITRNPKDTFFCEGVHPLGPYLDHVLEYWLESLKMPDKILFLNYEDLKRDPKEQVKKVAAFLGRPLLKDDDVEKLDVNKNGVVSQLKIPNSSFFRLGVVVDSKNYLTDEMTQNLDQITRMKLEGSGLDFDA
ncbi:hypothetical protein ACOSQ2_033106 [Xanthoceras sorbifolium]